MSSLDKIKFIPLDEYFHAYHVPNFHNTLLTYKDFIIEEFYQKKNNDNNTIINNTGLKEYLDKHLFFILDKFYISEIYPSYNQYLSYVQDNNHKGDPHFHSHIKDKVSITSVMYINPPKVGEGGEISLCFTHSNNVKTFQPQEDMIYLFPSWAFHKPEVQNVETPRICINWGIYSYTKPIHKITGNIW